MRRLALLLVATAGCQSILGIGETAVATFDARPEPLDAPVALDAPSGLDARGALDAPSGLDAPGTLDASPPDAHPVDASFSNASDAHPVDASPIIIDAGCGTMTCGALGCCVDHCCILVPANRAQYGGLQDNGVSVSTTTDLTFDTTNQCMTGSPLGNCVTEANACVCWTTSLSIHSLTVTGVNALVLLVWRSVSVTGTLNVAGEGVFNGPGGTSDLRHADFEDGGAGGSFATLGGASPRYASLAVRGGETLQPLVGGLGGQATCGNSGGGGGGALQISAGTSIDLSGVINAGGGAGGGGGSDSDCNGGSGGGSGGAVLLEAPVVMIHGTVTANGGGGGSGGTTSDDPESITGQVGGMGGEDGHTTASAAKGGKSVTGASCTNVGTVTSGQGGNGSLQDGEGQPGIVASLPVDCDDVVYSGGDGGGGGGTGRIRVNSRGGCDCGAGTFSPTASTGTTVVQ